MFDRMDLGSVHNRLKVRTGHTDIEGRNMAVSGNIPSENINTGNQFQMIDSEACDLFHNQIHPFVSFAVVHRLEFSELKILYNTEADAI